MGTDIYTRQGVLFEVSDIVPNLFGRIKNTQVKNIVEKINKHHADVECSSTTSQELCDWFVNLVDKSVGEEGYFSNEDVLISIWNIICKETKTSLPDVSFEYFTSNRISDYNVPTNVSCLVFSDHNLFKTVMTEKGKQVAKTLRLRKIESTTWTVWSY